MVYLVGVRDPHVAIGTSALAVAGNAANCLFHHARSGHVRWSIGLLFAAVGTAGALAGSSAGKAFDGQRLLFLFALLMIAVGALMLRQHRRGGGRERALGAKVSAKLGGLGVAAGLVSGFFGIGGGFLVSPALVSATNMAMIHAVGTSLIAVTAFGLATAVNYALSGLVDWPLAAIFVAGGFLGSAAGTRAAKRLSARGHLTTVFAGLVFLVAAYMLWRQWSQL
jgi:uncharacterized membrane protein YfcA